MDKLWFVVLVAGIALAGCLAAPAATPTPALDEVAGTELAVDAELAALENELGDVDGLLAELDEFERLQAEAANETT